MAVYTAAFAAAFPDLPLNIPPWHQLLLLYFHAFPMFFLQLLLCRRARAVWRLLVPLALLAVPGVILPERGGLDGHGMVPAPVVVCRAAAGERTGVAGVGSLSAKVGPGGWENRPGGAIIGSSEEK